MPAKLTSPREPTLRRTGGPAVAARAARGRGGPTGPGAVALLAWRLGVAGDEHAAVGDLEEAVPADELDRLAREPEPDVVAHTLEADPASGAHEARLGAQGEQDLLCLLRERRDRRRRLSGQLEALQRRHHADLVASSKS